MNFRTVAQAASVAWTGAAANDRVLCILEASSGFRALATPDVR